MKIRHVLPGDGWCCSYLLRKEPFYTINPVVYFCLGHREGVGDVIVPYVSYNGELIPANSVEADAEYPNVYYKDLFNPKHFSEAQQQNYIAWLQEESVNHFSIQFVTAEELWEDTFDEETDLVIPDTTDTTTGTVTNTAVPIDTSNWTKEQIIEFYENQE